MLKDKLKATTAILIGLSLATPFPAYAKTVSAPFVVAQATTEEELPPEGEAQPEQAPEAEAAPEPAAPPAAEPAPAPEPEPEPEAESAPAPDPAPEPAPAAEPAPEPEPAPVEEAAPADEAAEEAPSLEEATPDAATPEEVQEAVEEAPAPVAEPEATEEEAAPVEEATPDAAVEGEAEAEAEAEMEAQPEEAETEPQTGGGQMVEPAPEGETEAETEVDTETEAEAETETEAESDTTTEGEPAADTDDGATEDETTSDEAAPADDTTGEAPAEEAPADETAQEPSSEEPAADQAADEAPQEAEPDAAAADAEAEGEAEGDVAADTGEEAEVEAIADEEPVEVQQDTITEAEATTATRERSRDADDEDDDDRLRNLLGAAAAGFAVGALLPRSDTRVVDDYGDRVILERDGRYYVRRDENQLLYRPGSRVRTEEFRNGFTRTIVERRDGTRVITVRDDAGYVIRRTRVTPDGRRFMLYEAQPYYEREYVNYEETLPPLVIDIPRNRYIVDYQDADREVIYETFQAPPVQEIRETYSIQDVRESERLRDMVRRVDLTSVTFATGSSAIQPSQLESLDVIGQAMAQQIEENPREIFLIEGHTDAVGSDAANLALSDRRAESVALALTENYDVPPENLVVQGYGEQYLKVETQGPERANRRVTVRRITPLVSADRE